MLISSYHERQTRNSEKIRQLLNFLKEETYSDFKTLMLLFGFRIISRFIRCLQNGANGVNPEACA